MIFIFYGFHNPFGGKHPKSFFVCIQFNFKVGKIFFGKLLANILGTAKTLIALE